MATNRTDEAKELATGPHMLRIDRTSGANGAKKLSASLVTLCNVNPDHLRLAPIVQRTTGPIPELTLDDMLPNAEQRASLLTQAAVLAVQALTSYVGGLKKYADLPLFQFTPRRPLPEAYRTRTVPVATSSGPQYTPARHLSLVRDVYITKLGLADESFRDRAIPCINDSATNNSLRRVQEAAAKDSTAFKNLDCLQFGPGLSDIMRKLVKQTIKNHCPPGYNEGLTMLLRVINKEHITQCKPEDHEAALSALETVLTGALLECWRINCGFASLDEYAASNPKPEDMFKLAKKIVIKHAKRIVPKQPQRFEDDHEYSADNSDAADASDGVYRNHRLLNQSLIYIVLLKHAIADADFGRIEDFLGIICVMMMGAGMENTAQEIMHFLYSLKYLWPENFANIMRDSMIINLFKQGSNSMPADISVPHLGNYSRFFYAEHGFESVWRAPRNMEEAIKLVDDLDEKLEVKNISERMAEAGECRLM